MNKNTILLHIIKHYIYVYKNAESHLRTEFIITPKGTS
jgi:hypothetical protein